MSFEEIKSVVTEVIMEQLGVDEEQVTLAANVQDDLGADSLDIIDLLAAFEDKFSKFDFKVPDEDVETLKTVEDIVKYIENSIG